MSTTAACLSHLLTCIRHVVVVAVLHLHCWRSETAERRTSSLQLFLSLAVVTQSASAFPVQSFISSPDRLLGLPLPLASSRRPSKICVQRFCALIMCPKYCNFRFFTAATSSSCIDAVVTLRQRLPRLRMRSNADLVQLHARVTNASCSFVIVKLPPFHFTRSIYLAVDNYILRES